MLALTLLKTAKALTQHRSYLGQNESKVAKEEERNLKGEGCACVCVCLGKVCVCVSVCLCLGKARGVNQCIHTHISTLFGLCSCYVITEYWVEFCVLHSRSLLVTCCIYRLSECV